MVWSRRGSSAWVTVLQVGVTERTRVGSGSVEGRVTKILPQLTKCRAERVRMAWYGVVTMNTSAAADTVQRVYRYLGTTWSWAGRGGFATRRQVAGGSVM